MWSRNPSIYLLAAALTVTAAPERQKFAVYFGGAGADAANAVAVDADGNAYVAGQVSRRDGSKSAFVSKTNSDGSEILWTAYLKGTAANAVAIDSRGALWAAGDGFLARISANDGSVARSLETGYISAMALDRAGAVYVAGNGFAAKYVDFERVYSAEVAGAVRGIAVDDAGAAYITYGQFVSRLAPGTGAAEYALDLGWSARAVAVDGLGSAYVTGAAANVAKITPAGDAVAFQVQLRGVLEQEGTAIALDREGNIFVTGWTNSSDFARARGWHGERDGFLVKLGSAGNVLETTFAGTAARDVLQAMAIAANGDVFVAGSSEGAGLGSGPAAQLQGSTDAIVLKFASTGTRALTGTTTVLTTSPSSTAPFGQNVLLSATVSPAGTTGKVTFFDRTTIVGVATVSGGVANLSTPILPAGLRSLRAYYGGDVNFAASTSSNVALTVNPTPALTFSPLGGTTINIGGSPASAAVADFNGDGVADVAVTNTGNNTVTILLGNGSGGFTAAGSPLTTGIGPASVVANDFNGDGRPDIAVTNTNVNSISVFLNTGGAAFTPASGSPFSVVGSGPISSATGDFNSDGIVDIVTANVATNDFSLMLGNGSGGFTTAAGSPFAVGGAALTLASGDFNGDSKPDVAVGNLGSGTVVVFLGNGTGGFTAAPGSPFTVGSSPSSIAVGDLNSDGIADLAVANFTGPTVSILLGNGSGGFTNAAGSPISGFSSPRSIILFDYNADGKLDMAVANSNGGTINILQGNGAGGFTAVTGSPFGGYSSPNVVVSGEFTGDGRVDLAIVNSTSGTLSTIPGVGAPPIVVSGTPPSPTVTPQTITFLIRDNDGYANISRLYFLINTSATIPQNSCHGFYDRNENNFYLYNDSLTVLQGPLAPGSGGTLQNGQCILYGTGSSAAGSGTDLSVSIRMGMLGLYSTTTENIYIWAVDNQNLGTGWVQTGSWVLGAPIGNASPTVVSGTPANPASSPQTFTFTVRDANGSANLDRIYFLVNTTPTVPVNSCHGFYDRATNRIYLYNDNLSVLQGPLTPGSGGNLQNSQCSVNGTTSSLVSGAGTDLTINLGLSLLGNYGTVSQNVYIWVTDKEANGTGWVQTSTWGTASGPQPPTVVSGTPTNPTTSPQTFTFTARDANGATNIDRIYFLVNSTPSVPVNSCHGFYDRPTNQIYLYNNDLSVLQGPLSPGAGGSLSNSQCSVNGSTSALVSASGTDLVLNLGLSLLGNYATSTQNVYIWAVDAQATGTGWVKTSTWGNAGAQQPPSVVSGSPATPTGSPQTFTFVVRDPNGFSDLNRVYFQVYNSPTVPANTCHGFYDRAANAFFLYNDALSVLQGPLAPGANGTLSNSQCTLNGASSTPVTGSGTDLTVTVGLSLLGAYGSSQQKVYLWVTDNAAAGTGWVQVSTWNAAGGNQAPTLVSVTPGTTSSTTQTFSITGRDTNGFADVNRLYFLVNTNTSIPAGSCHGFYDRASNSIFLYNDALSAVTGPLTPGAGGTIQNSQCAINGALSSVTASGTDVVLNLSITRQGSYATGSRNLYIWVTDNSNAGTGWITGSAWNL